MVRKIKSSEQFYTKTIDGKTFKRGTGHRFKMDATKKAKDMKKRDSKVRVRVIYSKLTNAWVVWHRKV